VISLENTLFRQIKVIYKIISKSKQGKKIDFDLDSDVIGEVSREVRTWANQKGEEIEELKEAAEYRKEFLGNVSHELKTPIFNIQGFIDTLIDGGIHDPKINLKYLHKASQNVDRMVTLVEELDNISKLESGRLELNYSKFDICEVFTETFDDLEIKAETKGIAMDFKKSDRKPIWVSADKELIRGVITNLIVNSIKYGAEDGQTLVGFYDLNDKLLVEVSDNGVGIAQEHLPRLFERFYRVEQSRNRDEGGTGLGLAIVKHIIESHGETINVRSKEGEGSTFGFTISKSN
jgi:two-component system phosphate regulon sensor histidine kinase PhoR